MKNREKRERSMRFRSSVIWPGMKIHQAKMIPMKTRKRKRKLSAVASSNADTFMRRPLCYGFGLLVGFAGGFSPLGFFCSGFLSAGL